MKPKRIGFWTLLARTIFMATAAAIVGGPFYYLHQQFGPTIVVVAALCAACAVVPVFCVWLGGRMNDSGQMTFIRMVAQLKQALTASVREEARTVGAEQRSNIKLEEKEQLEQFKAQPSQDKLLTEQMRQDRLNRFLTEADVTVTDYRMEDIT